MEREGLRQMKGGRGAMEKRNGARGDWEDLWGTKTGEKMPVGEGKAEGNQQPLSPPGIAAVQGSPGISWSRDTPSWESQVAPFRSPKICQPACKKQATSIHSKQGTLPTPGPRLYPATTSPWTAHPWRISSRRGPGWDHPPQTLVPQVPSGPSATATLRVTGTQTSRKTEKLCPSCWI